MHADGDGLYLNVSRTGSKSWILRVTVRGERRRREIGLGGISHLSLADARKKASELRFEAKEGRNPIAVRDKRQMTFEAAARELYENLAPTFTSEKHGKLWISSLENHAFPHIGDREIETLQRSDVLGVLAPIWVEKYDTAKRLRQRISSVFDWAIGAGHFSAANPVDAALNKALPKRRGKPKHHAALPWQDMPAFFKLLQEREAIAARALEWIVFTAVRSNEARGARWDEIDLDAAVWSVPGERMKMDEPHRVPLSEAALLVLESVKGLDRDLVFPSPSRSQNGQAKQLSVNAFRPLFTRMDCLGMTVHGFRSTFRDWAAESAHADRAVAEAALAHKVGGVEGAYLRTDFFERRRDLMGAWGRYVTGQRGDVLELVRV